MIDQNQSQFLNVGEKTFKKQLEKYIHYTHTHRARKIYPIGCIGYIHPISYKI